MEKQQSERRVRLPGSRIVATGIIVLALCSCQTSRTVFDMHSEINVRGTVVGGGRPVSEAGVYFIDTGMDYVMSKKQFARKIGESDGYGVINAQIAYPWGRTSPANENLSTDEAAFKIEIRKSGFETVTREFALNSLQDNLGVARANLGTIDMQSRLEPQRFSDEKQPQETTKLDIAESVYRYLFTHTFSYQGDKAPAFYLELDNGDTPDHLLNRFKEHRPPVMQYSAMPKIEIDQRTFPRGPTVSGIIFWVREVTFVTEQVATARGGYYEGPLSASRATYHLRKLGHVWVVVRVTDSQIS